MDRNRPWVFENDIRDLTEGRGRRRWFSSKSPNQNPEVLFTSKNNIGGEHPTSLRKSPAPFTGERGYECCDAGGKKRGTGQSWELREGRVLVNPHVWGGLKPEGLYLCWGIRNTEKR